MTVAAADYTTVVTSCRRELARGGVLRGEDLRLIIDVVEHAANTLDSKAVAAVAALEALLVTHLDIWNAAKAGATATEYANAVAALATPRTAATAAAAASITDVTALDGPDGRTA